MPELRLHNVGFSYERSTGWGRVERTPVLERVSLSLASGEFIAVIGRSGSGKTSLLNLVAGFESPTEGRVTRDGQPIAGPGADRAVVFQDDALFAWLSVRDNVALPLQLKRVEPARRTEKAEQLLTLVGLAGQGSKAIWELSGGQRQRVGIARALAAEPDFLLLDEPLGALDAMTREQMQELLLKVWSVSRTGILLITHSIEEALFLGTRVVVLAPNPGRILDVQAFDFSQRYLGGEPARSIKADPAFIAARENLIAAIFADDLQAAA